MNQIDVFLSSLKRCLAHPEFLLDFYGLFMDSSEEIRQKFAHTDFKQQTRNDLDIRPGLYDSWLDCLVEAARKHDGQFSPEIEDAWRKTLAAGIEYMRSKY